METLKECAKLVGEMAIVIITYLVLSRILLEITLHLEK